MKRDELRGIGVAEELIDKIMDMNGKDINAEKSKVESYKAEISALKAQIEEKNGTITNLEKAGNDAEAIRKELETYKQAEKERAEREEAARLDATLTQVVQEALKGREFVNDFTRDHFISATKAELQKPENKGRSAAELFEALSKDVEGIWKNPQQEKLEIPPAGHEGNPGEKPKMPTFF